MQNYRHLMIKIIFMHLLMRKITSFWQRVLVSQNRYIFFLFSLAKTSEHLSRMELINLSGSEGKTRASVLQQRNKTPVMSSSSSLHSSHALTCCPGNLQAPSVCWFNTSRGSRNAWGENDVSSERGLRAHGSIEGVGSFPCCA